MLKHFLFWLFNYANRYGTIKLGKLTKRGQFRLSSFFCIKEQKIMAVADLITPTNGGIAVASIVAIMSLIQVSKIEVNPWTWLARKFGNAINHDVSEQIKEVNKRIDDVEASIDEVKQTQENDEAKADEYRAVTSRVRILKFNEELLRNIKHSKEMFDQVLEDVTKYTHYCAEHPEFENDKATMAVNNVRKCYEKCLEQHDFI